MSAQQKLPDTHRGLVLTSFNQPLEIKILPTPQPSAGNAIVRVEAAGILNYSKEIYNGTLKYGLPTPLIVGTSAIGRIAGVGPDATRLKPGQLVFIDSFIQARDDPSAYLLMGISDGFTDGSKKLSRGEWRDATYAEYVKMPLENCFPLNELLLESKFGYGVDQLQDIARLVVAFGGLRDINVIPGETVIVAPATGSFSSAAVTCALAMGARVIAVGRNKDTLKQLAASHNNERIETVTVTGDIEADAASLQAFGPVDAYFNIAPPAAKNSTHVTSCMLALRKGGRASFMSGLGPDVSLSMWTVVSRDLTVKGKWMYTRQDVFDLIKMIEIGLLKLGGQTVARFGLDDWEKAFDAATECVGPDKAAVIVP